MSPNYPNSLLKQTRKGSQITKYPSCVLDPTVTNWRDMMTVSHINTIFHFFLFSRQMVLMKLFPKAYKDINYNFVSWLRDLSSELRNEKIAWKLSLTLVAVRVMLSSDLFSTILVWPPPPSSPPSSETELEKKIILIFYSTLINFSPLNIPKVLYNSILINISHPTEKKHIQISMYFFPI